MQNSLNTEPSTSSVAIAPVSRPSAAAAPRSHSAANSGECHACKGHAQGQNQRVIRGMIMDDGGGWGWKLVTRAAAVPPPPPLTLPGMEPSTSPHLQTVVQALHARLHQLPVPLPADERHVAAKPPGNSRGGHQLRDRALQA